MDFNYDIAKTVSVSGRPQNPAIAQVVALVQGAPFALSLAQVVAVAKDAGIELPADTTVRNWLQAASERGEISRPTPRVYGPVGAEAPVEEAEETADEAVASVDEEDPLLAITG